jgi:hypothetical protein
MIESSVVRFWDGRCRSGFRSQKPYRRTGIEMGYGNRLKALLSASASRAATIRSPCAEALRGVYRPCGVGS